MLSIKKSLITSQLSSNGGRFTFDYQTSGNICKELTEKITTPYHERLIKSFLHNDADTPETNIALALKNPVAGAYSHFLATGTQRDTQATFAPTRYHSIGYLSGNAMIGEINLAVQFPTGADDLEVVQAGDTLTLTSADRSVTKNVMVAAAYFDAGIAYIQLSDPVDTNFLSNSLVSSAITTTSITATLSNVIKTDCVIDETQIELSNNGTVEQSFTLTFTSATAFTVTGDVIGSLPAGDISTQYAPLNPATNAPYLTIPATAWTSATTSATLTFDTHPAALPFWFVSRFYPGVSPIIYKFSASLLVSPY